MAEGEAGPRVRIVAAEEEASPRPLDIVGPTAPEEVTHSLAGRIAAVARSQWRVWLGEVRLRSHGGLRRRIDLFAAHVPVEGCFRFSCPLPQSLAGITACLALVRSLLGGESVTGITLDSSLLHRGVGGNSRTLAQVPEAISYSFVAGVAPMVGLHSAWIMCLSSSVLGGRPGLM